MSYFRARSITTIQQSLGLSSEVALAQAMAKRKAKALGLPAESNIAWSSAVVLGSGTPAEWIGKTAHYVRQGATGNGSGNDWTNAYTSLPATLQRNHVYYVAAGSYGSYTFDDAVSSTLKIYVVKATESDHGTSVGWNSAYGTGQAVFGTILLHTGYVMFHGQTRTESVAWEAPAGYGFRASGVRANSLDGNSGVGSYIAYTDLGGTWSTNPGSSTIGSYGPVVYLVYNQSNITFHRCAIHNGKALVYAHGSNGLVFEYCYIAQGWGKEAIAGPNVGFNNLIVRYSRFWNSTQTDPTDPTSGLTAEIGAFQGPSPTGNEFYGNVVRNTASGGRNASVFYGDPEVAINCKAFNNTFVDIPEVPFYSMIWLKNGSGNEIRNNLFWNCASSSVTGGGQSNNVTATVNPFVDSANGDYRISAGSQARNVGTALSSSYNQDPNGTIRGADGTWDVGAYEYAP